MTAPDLLRQLADCMEQKELLEAEVAALREQLRCALAKVQDDQKVWFTVRQAAAFIGKSKSFLNIDRCKAVATIPFVKHGPRSVRYMRDDLELYLESRLVGKRK